MRKVVLVAGVVILTFLLSGIWFYLRFDTNRAVGLLQSIGFVSKPIVVSKLSELEDQGSDGNLPDELTTKFDPTVNPVTLQVVAIDGNGKWWEMEGMSPESWRGRSVTTRLACPPWDTRINYEGSDTTKYTSVGKLKEQIGSLEGKVVIVSGVCADVTCSKINKACLVSVLGETK